jgi:hypothetical protein
MQVSIHLGVVAVLLQTSSRYDSYFVIALPLQVKADRLYVCVRHFHLKEQHMQYQILKEPMAMLDIHLDNAETITAEAGAMVYMQEILKLTFYI